MKNFKILWVYGKIRSLGVGFHEKLIYRGGGCLKREGLGQFADVGGRACQERAGWCF